MARVTVEDCVDKVPNRFELVLLAARRARYQAPPLAASRGTLHKYIRLVRSASEGCVTAA